MVERDSRVFELINELVGAQATAKILQECWDGLSPERRTEIAEQMGKRALAMISGEAETVGSGPVEWHISDAIKSIEVKLPDDLPDRLRAAVTARIEEQWKRLVNEIATQRLNEAMRAVQEQFKVPRP